MSEAWCDFGDLPESQCAHCRSGDKIPARMSTTQERAVKTSKEIHMGDPSPAVPAEYPGTCPNCMSPIEEGQLIRMALWAGRWVHEECA